MERYREVLQRITEYDEETGHGLLTERPKHKEGGMGGYHTNKGVWFVPLDAREGELGEKYNEYLGEKSPDNPIDSYVVICNNNPADPKKGEKKQYHFGHTWLHLNASGNNHVIQYYTAPGATTSPKNLKHLAASTAVGLGTAATVTAFANQSPEPLVKVGGTILGLGLGAIEALPFSVYYGSPAALVTSVHGQKSFHNAIMIPLRKRQAEIIRVDAEIDRTGELREYNFTNTIGRFKTGAGNCTSDSIARINNIGIPIGEAIEKATQGYKDAEHPKDIWFGHRDEIWGVTHRPGRLGRMIYGMKNAANSNQIEVEAFPPEDEEDGKSTTFKMEDCVLPMPDGKNLEVKRITTGADKESPMPVWDNFSDFLLRLAQQKGLYVDGGRVTDGPSFNKQEHEESLKATSIHHSGVYKECMQWTGLPRTFGGWLKAMTSPAFLQALKAESTANTHPSLIKGAP